MLLNTLITTTSRPYPCIPNILNMLLHTGDDDEPEFGSNERHIRALGARIRRSLTFCVWDDLIVTTLIWSQLSDLAAQPLAHTLSQNAERNAHVTSATRPVPILDLLYPPCSIALWVSQCFSAVLTRPATTVFLFSAGW